MSRVTETMLKNNKKSTFILQLTAMVDMFTILLVFFLKSFSSSPVNLTPVEDLSLPYSEASKMPEDVVKLVVTRKAIFIGEERILSLPGGLVDKVSLSEEDEQFIQPLFDALEKEIKKKQQISEIDDSLEFDGKILMQADKSLPYKTLKKVMYTSSMAGFFDMKLATVLKE